MLKKSVSILLVVVLVFSIFTIIPTISAEEIHSPDDTPETGGFTVQFGGSNVSFVEEESIPSKASDESASDQEILAEEPIEPYDEEEISIKDEKADLAPVGDGTFTVNGFTYSVTNRQATITGYNDRSITEINIPNKLGGYTVTGIGGYVFSNCYDLETVNIPDSVLYVGANAFENTAWYINQPDGLVYAGRVAYKYKGTMPADTVITLNSNTSSVTANAFEYCDTLKRINFNDGLEMIGPLAFFKCTSLEDVILPNSVKSIGDSAFSGDVTIEELQLGSGITSIGSYAFQDCTSLTEATVPKSVVSAPYAFSGCENLEKMSFENGMTTIPGCIACNCAYLTEVNLPDSVTAIGEYAFSDDVSLNTISLPKNLETLEQYAFQNTGLTEIIIPKSLKTVHGYSYYDHHGPFSGCEKLKKMIFEDGTVSVPEYIAAACIGLTEVSLPDTVTSIRSCAFSGCTSLLSITLPNSITVIEGSAFWRDESLTGLELPNKLTSLHGQAFGSCTSLTSIIIPKGVTSANQAFEGCSALKTMVFENGATVIPSYIAYGCSLKSVSIPDSVTAINEYAFTGNTELNNVVLSKNLETLGQYAFQNTGLTEIIIPKSLKTVHGYSYYDHHGPFSGCEKLKKMIFEDGTVSVPEYAAANCTALTAVSLPDTVTSIKDYAFASCSGLEDLYLPETVESVFSGAFYNSPKLTVHCCKKSKAAVSLIDNDINIVTYEPREVSESAVIDDEKSYYEARNTTGTSFVCSYSIKQSAFKSLSNPYIKIKIPNGAEISDQSLYCDGKICTDFEDYTDDYPRCIYVPVNNREGKITFNLTYEGDCKLVTYATLNYYQKGEERFEAIDIINNDIPVIAVYSEEITSSDTVHITGMAPASTEVKISVDGSYIKSVNTNKAGSFDADVKLPELIDGKDYTISASAEYNGEIITNQTKVRYQENAPELISFKMTYKGATYDLLSNTNYSISFVPGDTYPFHFEVKFSNPESIDHVFVTSTRNQSTRSVEAKWNKSKGVFVYTGFFDKDNYSYVPGKISCTFTLKTEVDDYDYDALIPYDDLPLWAKNAEVTKRIDTEDCIDAQIDFGNGIVWQYRAEKYESLDDFNADFFGKESNNSDIAPTGYVVDAYTDFAYLFIEKYGEAAFTKAIVKATDDGGYVALMKDDATGTYISKFYDPVSKTLTKQVLKQFTSDVLQDFTYMAPEDTLRVGGIVASGVSAGYTFYNKVQDINSLEDQIKNSDMSSSRKQKYLKDLEVAKVGYGGVAGMKVASACLSTAIGCAFTPIVGIAAGLLFGIGLALAEHAIDKMVDGYRIPSDSDLNFLVDPSGYVYACVESNRISGAKVTTYWIPYDEEDEDFWDNPDESSARIWEADEYSQLNPLYTDDHGDYAWDVPEGWWKVVVEKDGYETYTTEWLPVPPPQTEVNIGLVSNTAPQITNAEVDGKTITLTFSEYVDPESLTDITISDIENNLVDFTLTYSEDEKDATGKVYAKEYQLILDENYTVIKNQYLVTVSTAENYSGIVMDETTIEAVKLSNILGDVDGDDNVEIRDATWIQRNVADIEIPFAISKKTADVDGDDEITVMDATVIQHYLANMKNPYHIGETVS